MQISNQDRDEASRAAQAARQTAAAKEEDTTQYSQASCKVEGVFTSSKIVGAEASNGNADEEIGWEVKLVEEWKLVEVGEERSEFMKEVKSDESLS